MDNNPENNLIAKNLEQLSASITRSFNDRDFDFSTSLGREVLDRISPNFEAILCNRDAVSTNWDTLIEAQKFFFQARPEAHHSIRKISSNFNAKLGEVFVYVELDLQGADPGLTVRGMSTYLWKRDEEERWMLLRYWHMRGTGENEAFT